MLATSQEKATERKQHILQSGPLLLMTFVDGTFYHECDYQN